MKKNNIELRIMNNHTNIIFVIFVFLFLNSPFLIPSSEAAVMSSENYQMGTNAVGSGVSGALQTQSSANYIIEYPWRDTTASASSGGASITETIVSTETTASGGGILGSISGKIPSHINAFNTPLVVTEKQSGTLTYNFPDDMSIVVDTPKEITPKGITIIINAERKSTKNKYLIPPETELVGDIFWNITAVDFGGNTIKQLGKYITITIQIPDILIGVKDLGVYWFDNNQSKWILIPNTIFTKKTASFKVNHLTKFAIFGRKEISDNIDVSVSQEISKVLGVSPLIKKINIRKEDIIAPKENVGIEQLKKNFEITPKEFEKTTNVYKFSWLWFVILIIIIIIISKTTRR